MLTKLKTKSRAYKTSHFDRSGADSAVDRALRSFQNPWQEFGLGVRSESAAACAANVAVSGDVVISLSCLPVHIVLLVQLLKHQENAGCIEASLAQ